MDDDSEQSEDFSGPEEERIAVRCLICATVYEKPIRDSTVTSNPGCPCCGYVGWVGVSESEQPDPRSLTQGSLRARSAGDLLPPRPARRD